MRTKTFSKQTIVVAFFMLIASLLTSCRSSRNTSDMPYVFPIDLGDLCLEGYVDKDPVFPGDSLRDYIRENMVYPADALKDSIQGVVIVQFTVEKDGSITDVKALKQVHPLLDAEAVRLFSEMPKWEPGMLRDTLRRVQMLRSVHFVLWESVDLGLSVKWAVKNLYAAAPEDYGSYYVWGETESKGDYSSRWTTYKYCDGGEFTLTKYCNDSKYGLNGYTDDKTVLDPEDDAAHKLWGGDWRMPTIAEFKELIDSCTWTWTKLNGVNGYKITSNMEGYRDRSIFLPAAGLRSNTFVNYQGKGIFYWSASLHTRLAYMGDALYLQDDEVKPYGHARYYGFPIRPVHP